MDNDFSIDDLKFTLSEKTAFRLGGIEMIHAFSSFLLKHKLEPHESLIRFQLLLLEFQASEIYKSFSEIKNNEQSKF